MSDPAWSHPSYQEVAGLLGKQTGLAFSPARLAEVEAGIRRAMARAGAVQVSGYLAALESGRAGLDDLIAELTVGETYFFREPLQWEVLAQEVLPALQRQRPPEHVLRLWSAGCASGEEAYSLAILLDELGLSERGHILATDLSPLALERAQAARYTQWSLRGVDPARVERHFSPQGPRWQLEERLRRRVRLDRLNLATDPYPSFANGTWRLDVILCRNVLIYLDDASVRRVTARLGECLAPGGWLLLGASDPFVNDDGKLEAVTTRAGIFYRRPGDPAASLCSPPAPSGEAVVSAGSDPEDEGLSRTFSPESSGGGAGERAEDRAGDESGAGGDPLEAARAAFARGDYPLARRLAEELPDAAAAVLGVRAAANGQDPSEAERLASASLVRFPDCAELHLLQAVLLLGLGRHAEAVQAARRVLYLDRTLAMGHFLLGTALARLDDRHAAGKAFRDAHALCARLPPDQPVPFADGERAAPLAQAALVQLQLLAVGRAS
jgi:chemotaxis protein methyltransferase CheR